VPEVIDHGVSGLVVDELDDAVRAAGAAAELDRAAVRAQFERRFTVERMCDDYLDVYQLLVDGRDEHVELHTAAGGIGPRAAFRAPGS
jgi:glycosyltransferase involved in cell wall biosynthesis